jgi:drug/metabolite transporter (DMT)-like permease
MASQGHPRIALAVAVTAISTAAVLIRLAPEVHPIAAAFWRTLAVGVILSPGIWRFTRSGTGIRRSDLTLIFVAALVLGLHFWAWFESIHRTTVLRSTLLVCLTPIWAGVLEGVVLKRPPMRRFWAGIGITLVGVGLMTGTDSGEAGWSGDLLAILGGVLAAIYLLIGRVVRERVDIDAYGSILCLACAAWLLLPALFLDVELGGFRDTEWMVLAGLALGPQLLGHMGLNYAVRYLPAAVVSSMVLLEPVGAAILGAIIPSIGEIPQPLTMAGCVLALIGVYWATRRPSVDTSPDPSHPSPD